MDRTQAETSRSYNEIAEKESHDTMTNIRIAFARTEDVRKTLAQEEWRDMAELMGLERRNALEKYEEITRKWEMIVEQVIPQNIQQLMGENR